MRRPLTSCSLLAILAAAPLGGCGTIAGTAVSPITGGVDLCVQSLRPNEWYYVPFVFVAGAVGGPFVAFYNGVNYDPKALTIPLDEYWAGFDRLFRPWDQIL